MNELTDLSDCLLLLNVPYNARLLSQGKRLKIDHSIVARHIIPASQPNLVVGDSVQRVALFIILSSLSKNFLYLYPEH